MLLFQDLFNSISLTWFSSPLCRPHVYECFAPTLPSQWDLPHHTFQIVVLVLLVLTVLSACFSLLCVLFSIALNYLFGICLLALESVPWGLKLGLELEICVATLPLPGYLMLGKSFHLFSECQGIYQDDLWGPQFVFLYEKIKTVLQLLFESNKCRVTRVALS